jgi:phosphomannomutase
MGWEFRLPGESASFVGDSPSATYPAVPVSIFKAYDVRGLYGDEIDGDVAYEVGRAFTRVLGGSNPRVGLGRDMRLTAPELAQRYRDGMVAEGAHVVDAGMVGTEMLYWLVGSQDLDGGLMCTASHNPKAYTGAKLVEKGAVALSGDTGIGEIREMVSAGLGDAPGGGTHETRDIYDDFQRAAMRFIDPEKIKPLKVVVDGGNGMAGPMVGPVLDQLGLDLVTTYWEPDGEFPDHEPNPLLPENRQFIIDKVRAEGADLGIAWDGDADRCFFIDDTGTFVDGDFMTALLAESVLEKQPAADILYDVRASRAVPDTVARLGGTAHVNRVGHAFFKRRMRDEGGAFGGEVSGHYYFADFYNADSGTIPALLILELLSTHDATLSELLQPLRGRYFISGEINSTVADPDAKLAEIEDRYGDGAITKLDGISIDYDDWHFNVRPSNTEPLLRLNLESVVSQQDMQRRRDEVLDLIRS